MSEIVIKEITGDMLSQESYVRPRWLLFIVGTIEGERAAHKPISANVGVTHNIENLLHYILYHQSTMLYIVFFKGLSSLFNRVVDKLPFL